LPDNRPARLDSIQVLRGIAAILVVLHHFAFASADYSGQPSWIVKSGLATLGASGVDLFFVISGFIMVYTTRQKAGARYAIDFMKKRLFRIYPLYWVWTTVLVALWLSGHAFNSHKFSASYIWQSYLLFPAFSGSNYHPMLDQGWTLSFEILFYIVFALSLYFGFKKHKLFFLVPAFAVLILAGHNLLLLPSPLKYLFSSPLLLEFLYGVAAGEIVLRFGTALKTSWNSMIPLLLMMAGVTALAASSRFAAAESLRFLAWGIPAFLVVLAAGLASHRSYGRLWVYLGNASYSIYLTHGFFTSAYGSFLKHAAPLRAAPADLMIVGMTALTVAVTSLGYLMVERPLQRLVSRPRPMPMAVPAAA